MSIKSRHILAAIVSGLLMIPPAFADKPDWAGGGNGKGNKHQQARGESRQAGEPQYQQGSRREKGSSKHEAPGKKHQTRFDNDKGRNNGKRDGNNDEGRGDRDRVSVNIHFNSQQQSYLREYYGREFRSGHCPPGLAKKNNGCMPPGQAKKWRVGHPLARDVVFYDLPPAVIAHIGVPPRGYRYVRVASDILMIAIGSGMVVDAIADLNRM